jgi:hypothetical protein
MLSPCSRADEGEHVEGCPGWQLSFENGCIRNRCLVNRLAQMDWEIKKYQLNSLCSEAEVGDIGQSRPRCGKHVTNSKSANDQRAGQQ